MKTSISDYSEYKNVCLEASLDDDVFNNFKRNPHYTPILEHASYDLGLGYIKWLSENNFNTDKLDILKQNDEQGNATLESYPEPFGNISPSTLRYTKVLAELEKLFGSLDGKKIVEIGVGYGGQCKLINDYFNIASYTLIDLPEVLQLSKRYLSKYNYNNVEFKTLNLLNQSDYDLVISNYAFSECERSIQLDYVDKVLKNSKNGYITFNNICHLFNIETLSKQEVMDLISCNEMGEEPVSGANCILYW